MRLVTLRYPGECRRCRVDLRPGAQAWHDPSHKLVSCLRCPPRLPPTRPLVGLPSGSPGASSMLRHGRQTCPASGLLGDLLRLVGSSSWGAGAAGERLLASYLAGLSPQGVRVLHDRSVPGASYNLDHVVVSPAGVFVVDTKNYRGRVVVSDAPGQTPCLRVGHAVRMDLVEQMTWQVRLVGSALAGVPCLPGGVVVRPVLCFVSHPGPLPHRWGSLQGVQVLGPAGVRHLVTSPGLLSSGAVEGIFEHLSGALPPA